MKKRARRRDDAEPAIVRALEAVGASVERLDGTGVPDLLVGFRDATFLLEVKEPDGKGGVRRTSRGASQDERGLHDSQRDWWGRWRGSSPIVVTTPAEALAAIGWRGSIVPAKVQPEPLPELMGCSRCPLVFDARGANRYVDGIHPPIHWLREKNDKGKLPICPGHRLPAVLPELGTKET